VDDSKLFGGNANLSPEFWPYLPNATVPRLGRVRGGELNDLLHRVCSAMMLCG
jgi:hypothetical protein